MKTGYLHGDGKDDLLVSNQSDWSVGYLLVLKSTGNDLQFVRRYDDNLPGWGAMKRNDTFMVANFDGDTRDDLYVSNQRDWSVGYLELLRSNSSGFDYTIRYDKTLPGWDDMKSGDQFFVADVNADKKADLYVFNGTDWVMPYLEMLGSSGRELKAIRRFDRDVPGWGEMRKHDRWFPADLNGDESRDLYVFRLERFVIAKVVDRNALVTEVLN